MAVVEPAARPMGLKRRFERYAIAHASAYLIAFLCAMAAIPLAIHLFFPELAALGDDMPPVGQFVVRRIAWPAGVVFIVPHIAGLPWAFAKEPTRWARVTWTCIGGVAALGAVFGIASWLWLFLRS
jgi:hypothetical protein